MALTESAPGPDDDPDARSSTVVAGLTPWEIALQSVSHLATVFALSLAFILVLAHQLAHLG